MVNQPDEQRIDARKAAAQAVAYLSEMTGQEPEIVVSVQAENDHWRVRAELLELSRVPNTTDVLGCYEVELDGSGQPRGFHRTGRYHRGHVGSDI